MDSLSPYQVERILHAGVVRAFLSDQQIKRINSTLDQWQRTIRVSEQGKVVEKYQRALHRAVSQLWYITCFKNPHVGYSNKQYAQMSYLAYTEEIGIHIKDIISLIVGYGGGDDGKSNISDDGNSSDGYDDDGYWSDDWDYYGFSDRYYY